MSVIVPGHSRPSNLHLPEGTNVREIDSDVYNICTQLKGISNRLFVVLLEGDDQYSFAVMEHCIDDVDRLVFRVKELDQRVVRKLYKLMELSLSDRMDQLEKDEYRMQQEQKELELDELYERFGRPMLSQLEHDGFTQRPVSYPKRGVKATTPEAP